jgi:hypothetical protein
MIASFAAQVVVVDRDGVVNGHNFYMLGAVGQVWLLTVPLTTAQQAASLAVTRPFTHHTTQLRKRPLWLLHDHSTHHATAAQAARLAVT